MHDYQMFYHWALPKAGCNEGTRYVTHPLGKSSKCIPLDCNLFKDWNDRVDYHVMLTIDVDRKDPKKFFTTIPKRLVSAMSRV